MLQEWCQPGPRLGTCPLALPALVSTQAVNTHGGERGAKPPRHLHHAARLLWASEQAGREVARAGHILPRSLKSPKKQARRRTGGSRGTAGQRLRLSIGCPAKAGRAGSCCG